MTSATDRLRALLIQAAVNLAAARGWLHGVQEGKVTEDEWRDLATKPIGTVVRK